MKHLFKVLFLIAFVFSCSNDNNEIESEINNSDFSKKELSTILTNNFGYKIIENTSNKLNKRDETKNYDEIITYSNEYDLEITLYKHKSAPKKYLVIKSNGENFKANLAYTNGNGYLNSRKLSNNELLIDVTFENGDITDRLPSGGACDCDCDCATLCQRNEGEDFRTCFNRERDEFCDDAAGCIAVNISPLVNLVIAAACSC